jgi:hypothetical protein
MHIALGVLIGLVVLGAQTTRSPFNTYRVFLDRAQMPGGCSITDTAHFRNRSYVFRGSMHRDTPLALRDGKARELNELRKPEWETELVRQSVVSVGGQSAVMLRFLANHVGGTGSWGMVLIGTCNDRQLTVVFEAESQGLSDITFTAEQDLVVSRAMWTTSDAHCCPSGKAEERYRWDRNTGRFVHVGPRLNRMLGA